jgi:hypothetical protein
MKLRLSTTKNPLQTFSLSSMSFQFLPNSLRNFFVLHQQVSFTCVHGIDYTPIPQHCLHVPKQQFNNNPQQILQ